MTTHLSLSISRLLQLSCAIAAATPFLIALAVGGAIAGVGADLEAAGAQSAHLAPRPSRRQRRQQVDDPGLALQEHFDGPGPGQSGGI